MFHPSQFFSREAIASISLWDHYSTGRAPSGILIKGLSFAFFKRNTLRMDREGYLFISSSYPGATCDEGVLFEGRHAIEIN